MDSPGRVVPASVQEQQLDQLSLSVELSDASSSGSSSSSSVSASASASASVSGAENVQSQGVTAPYDLQRAPQESVQILQRQQPATSPSSSGSTASSSSSSAQGAATSVAVAAAAEAAASFGSVSRAGAEQGNGTSPLTAMNGDFRPRMAGAELYGVFVGDLEQWMDECYLQSLFHGRLAFAKAPAVTLAAREEVDRIEANSGPLEEERQQEEGTNAASGAESSRLAGGENGASSAPAAEGGAAAARSAAPSGEAAAASDSTPESAEDAQAAALVDHVRIIRDRNSFRHAGYGFVYFRTEKAAAAVIRAYEDHVMPGTDNRLFRLGWAAQSRNSAPNSAMHGGHASSAVNAQQISSQNMQAEVVATPPAADFVIKSGNEEALFIGDLAQDVNDGLLLRTFQFYFSSVYAARVVMDHVSQRSKGYGFVFFGKPQERLRALQEMQGFYLSTRPINVNVATKREQGRPVSPGRPASPHGTGEQQHGEGAQAAPAEHAPAPVAKVAYPKLDYGSAKSNQLRGGSGRRGGRGGGQQQQQSQQQPGRGQQQQNLQQQPGGGVVALRQQQPGGGQLQLRQQQPVEDGPGPNSTNSTLFVGGIDDERVTPPMLSDAFGVHGTVISVKVLPGRNCCFIEYASHHEAWGVMQLYRAGRPITDTDITAPNARLKVGWGKGGPSAYGKVPFRGGRGSPRFHGL